MKNLPGITLFIAVTVDTKIIHMVDHEIEMSMLKTWLRRQILLDIQPVDQMAMKTDMMINDQTKFRLIKEGY